LFEALITELQKHKVEVILIALPYHPDAYQFLKTNKKYAQVPEVEKFLSEFSKNNGIEFYGTYDPAVYNLDKGYFLDAMHLKEEGVKVFILKHFGKPN
jgi:hypothetical protein